MCCMIIVLLCVLYSCRCCARPELLLCVYMYIYIYIYIYTHTNTLCIYVYGERERDIHTQYIS